MAIYELKDVIDVKVGKKPNNNLDSYLDENSNFGYPFPKQSDINNYTLTNTKLFFDKNKIWMTILDDGKGVYFMPDAEVKLFKSNIPFCMSPSIWRLDTINQNILNNRFIFYLLLGNKEKIKELSHGTTIKHISLKDFKKFKFFIPELDVQNTIINIIEPFEKKLNNRIDFLDLVTKFFKTISFNETNINFSDFFNLVKEKGDLFEEVIDLSSMKSDSISLSSFSMTKNFSTNIFCCKESDFLIGSIRPKLKKASFAWKDINVLGTIYTLRIKEMNQRGVGLFNILNDSNFDYFIRNSKGTKMPILSKDDLLRCSIKKPLFDLRILNILFDYTKAINKSIYLLTKIIEKLVDYCIIESV